MNAPRAKLPLSPMKISAGWQLYHKNPNSEPKSADDTTTSSPTPIVFGSSKYELKTAFPANHTKMLNVVIAQMLGTVASPSSPSVIFVAFDAATITKIQKNKAKYFKSITEFL